MKKTELRAKIFSKIDELPTLPVVLPRLLNLMQSEKSDASDIAWVISHDPALTSKTLKVANSAYYGFSQEICSLDRAVPLLGLNMVRSLALSIGVIGSLPKGKDKSFHFSREDLWIHSLAVATAVQELGRRTGKRKNNEHLFVVGLLHDIGKIVLDQFFSEAFSIALEEAWNRQDLSLHMAERNIIGMDHGEIGNMLLRRWKFPAIISDPISVHHQTEISEGINPTDLALLRVADTLSRELGFGQREFFACPENYQADIELLGMDEEGQSDMKAYLTDAKDGIYDFFSALN
ncbi:MAG: HDOD domain-containing protein [Desulfobulbaceae bacterium]|nr:HDOD domain-containing protein [Desulfobulbaceae bacterium]